MLKISPKKGKKNTQKIDNKIKCHLRTPKRRNYQGNYTGKFPRAKDVHLQGQRMGPIQGTHLGHSITTKLQNTRYKGQKLKTSWGGGGVT